MEKCRETALKWGIDYKLVNGMAIYVRGDGKKKLVFLSGSGTPSPILDFKSLSDRLKDDFTVIVVEKLGYGFSVDTRKKRDIATMVEEIRGALLEAGIEGPYYLSPHSMSGLEALYWAAMYEEEVEGIIGLDMVVPEYYVKMKFNSNIPRFIWLRLSCFLGIEMRRSKKKNSYYYEKSALSEREKSMIYELYGKRSVSNALFNENRLWAKNARTVDKLPLPKCPVIMFISDGTGGTGYNKNEWIRIQKEYAQGLPQGSFIELPCTHYVHNFEYDRIAEEIISWINQ